MRTKTTFTALLALALFCVGCATDEPSISHLPDIDEATAAENKANAQKRGWVQVEPLTLSELMEKSEPVR